MWSELTVPNNMEGTAPRWFDLNEIWQVFQTLLRRDRHLRMCGRSVTTGQHCCVRYTRQATYVWRSIEARSCNHCCCGKPISITYSGCVFVALDIQHANAHAPYCHLWPARLYNIFPHYLINGNIFGGEKSYWTYNVCFDCLCSSCL